MREVVLFFLCIYFFNNYSQTITVKDQITNEVISNVLVKNSRGAVLYSKDNGTVQLQGVNELDTLEFIHPGYFPKKINYSKSIQFVLLQSRIVELDEIVFSAGRQEEKKNKIPFQIEMIERKQIEFSNQQTTADLLQNSGQIFVQKSQAGGGSPILRGFEANKVLLVVDGVRMNNAIYRGGHLQDIITIDQNMLERTEILFGTSSTVYGSDALGGVIHLITKEPKFSVGGKPNFSMNNFVRYSSVNSEKTGHIDFNIGYDKIAFITNITFSDFGELKSGKTHLKGFDPKWEQAYYQVFENGKDTITKNPNLNLQRLTGYNQLDVMQKINFKLGQKLISGLNLQYSVSSEINRYDRLSEKNNDVFRWAEWKYGPQKRGLASLFFESVKPFVFADHFKFIAAYQKIDQDRISRRFGNANRRFQREDVMVYSFNADLLKKLGKFHELKYGFEFTFNEVNSSAEQINIFTQHKTPFGTRYPDAGSFIQNLAAYLSHTWTLKENFYLVSGIRFTNSKLSAKWRDTIVLKLPFNSTNYNNNAFSGNIGLVYNTFDNWKFSVLLSSGFRSPNVDDLGKVNESVTGNLIIPNPNLKPEYAYTIEAGISKIFKDRFKLEWNAYYTILENAMTLKNDQLDGKDSILYGNSISQIQSLQNVDYAFLYGISGGILMDISPNFSFKSTLTYTYGRYIDVVKDSVLPLDHIPPVYGQTNIKYKINSFETDFFVRYNGWKKIKDYRLGAEDNELYATAKGMPAWYTININLNYSPLKNLRLGLACENITDNHYRLFASGVSAPGRNFIFSLRYKI